MGDHLTSNEILGKLSKLGKFAGSTGISKDLEYLALTEGYVNPICAYYKKRENLTKTTHQLLHPMKLPSFWKAAKFLFVHFHLGVWFGVSAIVQV